MRSMLVIGLGRFGTHLAKNLIQLNNEVMVVDKDEESVSRLEPYVTQGSDRGLCRRGGAAGAGSGKFRRLFRLYQR